MNNLIDSLNKVTDENNKENKEYTFSDIDGLKGYNRGQKEELKKGISKKVDIRHYMDQKYNRKQMKQIRKGLESGVDVSKYSYYKFSDKQMKEIREGLENNICVDYYCSVKIDYRSMRLIKEMLIDGKDIKEINISLPYNLLKKKIRGDKS